MDRIAATNSPQTEPSCDSLVRKRLAYAAFPLCLLFFMALPLHGREHKTRKEDYGLGYSNALSAPENEVLQAVYDVVNNGMIQGSKEYAKDKYIEKASPADSSPLFPKWTGPGQVFYKVRTQVLAPMNFKESNDEGTLAVRYVVTGESPQKTIVRIDSVFVEDFRHTVHPSNGSVETAEYKDIQDRVDNIELQKKQTAESERHRQEELAKQSLERTKQLEQQAAFETEQNPGETLEQRVANLRHELERVVKTSGAELKSAPFHTATNLKTLDGGADVLVLIVTPYWYGVETEDGQHGWVNRSQLEPLP